MKYIDDIIEFNYYVKITEEQNLSVRDLRQRIKSNEYDRLDDKTKMKLKNHEKEKATDFIKDPILIKNKATILRTNTIVNFPITLI